MAKCVFCHNYEKYEFKDKEVIHTCIIQSTSEDPGEIAKSLVTRETDCEYFILSDCKDCQDNLCKLYTPE